MKKFLLVLTLLGAFFLFTTQVFAGPSAAGGPKKTPGTPPGPAVTPGPKHTKMPKLKGKPQVFRGVIASVSDSSLTITLRDGSSVTVSLDAGTRIHLPGNRDGSATLQVGMQVVLQARSDENGTLVAQKVMAIPGKPSRTHRVGWVTDYQPGVSITIQARDGNTYTFQLASQVKILPAHRATQLAPGALVTIIAPRNPSQLNWVAVGIVVHPATQSITPVPTTTTTATATP